MQKDVKEIFFMNFGFWRNVGVSQKFQELPLPGIFDIRKDGTQIFVENLLSHNAGNIVEK